jgi:TonB family protein
MTATRSRFGNRQLACVVLAVMPAGCSATMAAYPGPRRPAAEVAHLRAPDMDIVAVDGYQAGISTSEFDVAPGTHVVVAHIDGRRRNVRVSSEEPMRLCFAAEAGHSYAIIPRLLVRQRMWYPRVADETTDGWVPVQMLATVTATCALEHAKPVFHIAWPVGQGGLRAKATDERAACFEQVKERVESFWDPIEEYARRNPDGPALGMRKWATVLHARINADGSLADVQTIVPSGAPGLDEIAVAAVQQAQPFAPPPPELVKRAGIVTIPLAFEIMAAGRVR